MVYETTLRLPQEYLIPPDTVITPDLSNYVHRLKDALSQLRPTPTIHSSTRNVFVSRDLSATAHVFVRKGGVLHCLLAPYDGLFLVFKRTP